MTFAILPRRFLRCVIDDSTSQYTLNVAICNGTALLALFFFPSILGHLGAIPHFCLFEKFLGIPCPGCGVITSLSLLSHGKLFESVSVNPLGAITVVFTFAALFNSLYALRACFREQAMIILRHIERLYGFLAVCLWIIRCLT